MARRPENSFMQQSLVASFMEQDENLSVLGKSKINASRIGGQAKFDLTKPDMSIRGNATGLDISTRPAAAHLDLTKPPDLEMTHNATGLGDITKPANLELSDLDVSNNLEITKPEFNNDSCIDQEVNGAR